MINAELECLLLNLLSTLNHANDLESLGYNQRHAEIFPGEVDDTGTSVKVYMDAAEEIKNELELRRTEIKNFLRNVRHTNGECKETPDNG